MSDLFKSDPQERPKAETDLGHTVEFWTPEDWLKASGQAKKRRVRRVWRKYTK